MAKLGWSCGVGLLAILAWHRGFLQAPPIQEPPGVTSNWLSASPRQGVAPGVARKIEVHPFTVSGRSLGPDGKPLAGARVYVASRWGEVRRLGETTTDGLGRYEFRDLLLPIKPGDWRTGPDHGSFQVFGDAQGHGFAWQYEKQFYPRRNHSMDLWDVSNLYFPGDPIDLALQFSPPGRLAGTVIDDLGNPLPDALLEIRNCQRKLVVDPRAAINYHPAPFPSLNDPDVVPASMKFRRSDALGRFEFSGLPVGCRFRVVASADGRASRSIVATTAVETAAELEKVFPGKAVQVGDLNLALAAPMVFPIRMVFGDTGKPAVGVFVQAEGESVRTHATSDEQGIATLKVPAGRYRLVAWPKAHTPYLLTKSDLAFGEAPPAVPPSLALRPAATVELIVRDRDTGQALPGVEFMQENGLTLSGFDLLQTADVAFVPVVRSWEGEKPIGWQAPPRTDDRGRFRVFVEPGKRRFIVERPAAAEDRVEVQPAGQVADCRTGETATLEFLLARPR